MPLLEDHTTLDGQYHIHYVYVPPLFGESSADGPVETVQVAFQNLVKTWVRTPGYFQKRKDARRTGHFLDLPMNNFSYEYEKTSSQGGNYTHIIYTNPPSKESYIRREFVGNVNVAPPSPNHLNACGVPSHDVDAIFNRLKTNTLLELKDQKVNLVQTFAERDQLARMMTSTLLRFTGAVKALKSGNFRDAARQLGVSASRKRGSQYRSAYAKDKSSAVSQGWLELQYGWKPFLQDIYGSAELIAQKEIREIRNRLVKSRTDILFNRRSVRLPEGHTITSECESRLTCKYTLWYSTDDVQHTLTQLGITNPLLIAWELTPWSFVIDWFIPIGNYISTLDATLGLKFQKGCVTTFQRITFNSKATSGAGAFGADAMEVNHGYLYKKVIVHRTVLTDFPSTSLPQFKNPLSFLHFANALALAKTSFGRKF